MWNRDSVWVSLSMRTLGETFPPMLWGGEGLKGSTPPPAPCPESSGKGSQGRRNRDSVWVSMSMRMLGETFPPLLWGDRGG